MDHELLLPYLLQPELLKEHRPLIIASHDAFL